MIHEENKKQQDETEDFSMDNFLPDERKKTVQTQQDDFARRQIDEEVLMQVIAGDEPAEVVRERMKQSAGNPKRTTSKPKN